MSTVIPAVKWAERNDRVFVTVEAPGAKAEDVQVVLEDNGKFEFRWKQFALVAELLKEIVKEKSQWAFTGRSVVFDIVKKDEGYWNKLFKVPAGKPAWLTVDWARWKDEDDDDEDDEANPMAGMDFSSLMNGGGMGGMDGMNFGDMGADDDDDDEMPDLEGDVPEEEDENAAAPAPEGEAKKAADEEDDKKEKDAAPAAN